MCDTRVRYAPAVAKCGRGVVVAMDSADRPVQAPTESGAEVTPRLAGRPTAWTLLWP